VQTGQSGSYAVLVSDGYGSTLSSNATLTVYTPLPCATAPSNLISWWRAEADARDSAGTNNGVLGGGLSFAPGEVGQASSFNGAGINLKIPATPSLDLGAGNGLTAELWLKPAD